jgi:cytochrome c-type biogenesis protein CcmH
LGLLVVALVVLVVGTQRSGHPSLQDKTMHIAGLVRCPVCEGQSAAESQAPASVQIRDQIRQELSAGESQSQILSALVAAYGPGILEKPEARGIGLLLWVLPVLAVVVAIAGLALAFARWRPRRGAGVTPADRVLVDQALRREPWLGGEESRGDVGTGDQIDPVDGRGDVDGRGSDGRPGGELGHRRARNETGAGWDDG